MGAANLIDAMQDAGFTIEPMGGNIRAMVQRINGRTIVATAEDGDLPFEDDFLICLYDGDWIADPDAPLISEATFGDFPGVSPSGLPPIDEALQQARDKATT